MADDHLHARVRSAVESFWFERDGQTDRLSDGGAAGGAARANGHLGEFTRLVARLFLDAGVPPSAVRTGAPYLPGYYRARKQWDLVVVHRGHLVAAVEFKSQVGSVGKNASNRFEEALGTSTDTHAAQRKNGAFGDVPPWLGYVFVLQETAETERSGGRAHALFPIDPVFAGLSYSERYQMMLSRFVADQIYDAGWFVTTRREPGGAVSYREPLATACAATFEAAVIGRVAYVDAVARQSGGRPEPARRSTRAPRRTG